MHESLLSLVSTLSPAPTARCSLELSSNWPEQAAFQGTSPNRDSYFSSSVQTETPFPSSGSLRFTEDQKFGFNPQCTNQDHLLLLRKRASSARQYVSHNQAFDHVALSSVTSTSKEALRFWLIFKSHFSMTF